MIFKLFFIQAIKTPIFDQYKTQIILILIYFIVILQYSKTAISRFDRKKKYIIPFSTYGCR